MAVEHLDQLGEIGQRAAETVDLVDHDHIDQPVLDILHQPLQAGPLQRAARQAAVVILIADQHPALGALAGHERLAGLALGVERVELLLQPFLGRFARVDRAALFAHRGLHARALRLFNPKNTQPFQRVPVIARAMADSDL